MPLQSTGGTWAQILQPDLLPLAVRKGVVTDILIRDYLVNGVPNNLAAASAGLNNNGVFTPFAQDGTLRSDLLITAAGANQGFFHIGLLEEKGWTFTPNVSVDQTPVAQSPWSVRNDVTKEEGELMFAAREWKPLIDYLRMDLTTISTTGASVVPDIGTAQYSVAAPAYQNLVERQIIALGFDGANQFSITCPRVSQKKLGKTEANKKTAVDLEFTYELLLCPFTQTPYILSMGGPGWLALGGVPTFPGSAPVATAIAGSKATVAFTTPTGLDAPFTYTVNQSTNGGTTWVASTLSGSPTVAGSTTTVTVSGLVTSTVYVFQVIATGTNNATATSANSNSITST